MKDIEEHLKKYYTGTLGSFGPGAKGMGWKSEETQEKRFAQLTKIFEKNNHFSINDLGCGAGGFLHYLTVHPYADFSYTGYDVLDAMLAQAVKRYGPTEHAFFRKVKGAGELAPADYTVASGIFNLKYSIEETTWINYILQTLAHMDHNSSKGFAFNMLTKYSDADLMQKDLYYGDPLFLFDYCKKKFSKNIALLHDYDEYDFTILVRK